MTVRKKDELLSFLFDREGKELRNIKFFRGDRDLVSCEELRTEVHSSFVQKKSGRATVTEEFPDIDAQSVDVKEFVNHL